MQHVAGGDHCDKGAVGTTVIEPFQIALPIREDLAATMSIMIIEYASRYHEIKKRALERLRPTCSSRLANRAGYAASDEVAQYNVADMSSELILLVASAGIGVLLSICAPGVPKAAK